MREWLFLIIFLLTNGVGEAQIRTPQQPQFQKFQPASTTHSYPPGPGATQHPNTTVAKPSPNTYKSPNRTIPDDVRKDINEVLNQPVSYNLYNHPAGRAKEDAFEQAFQLFRQMLEQNKPDFKKAVFISEIAYQQGLSYEHFNKEIQALAQKAMYLASTQADIEKDTLMALTWALKHLMVDTMHLMKNGQVYNEITFTYDFEDVFGSEDIRKMFVTKLLNQGSGNCHSFPYLYKILAQELGVGEQVHLAYAPNHAFIRMKLDGRWWNLELTNGYFLQDWFMMATGYIHVPGIQGQIYMTPLNERESIAACVMDLATYYEARYGLDNFVLKCCELALQYYPNCIQALMVKANCWNLVVSQKMDYYQLNTAEEAKKHPAVAKDFKIMEGVFALIDEKGYVPVPEEQYMEWLESMKQEKEKRAGFK